MPQPKAVFFDSGHTLMRPLTGRWFPGADFFALCAEAGQQVADDTALEAACSTAYQYLVEHHRDVPDIDAELAQFTRYYEIVFETLGRSVDGPLPARLAERIVLEPNFEPYPETEATLTELRDLGVPMAVITDAWPSVRMKFERLGFMQYFKAFVVSAEERCNKPDMGMFRPALDAIGVEPGEVLFVDDSVELVEAVSRHGFSVLLADYEDEHRDIPRRITSIGQVPEIVRGD